MEGGKEEEEGKEGQKRTRVMGSKGASWLADWLLLSQDGGKYGGRY